MQNIDKSHRYGAEWKKPVSKGNICVQSDFLYVKFYKEPNYRDREEINGWLGLGVTTKRQHEGVFWGAGGGIIMYSDCGNDYSVSIYV